jgi:hypothetical protein
VATLTVGIGLTVGLVSAQVPQAPAAPTRANILRGEYGRYRANNDVLSYHLDVRVDPDKKLVAGTNRIRFKMLADDNRMQIDLWANMNVDKILLGQTTLTYDRELTAVFVNFPETVKQTDRKRVSTRRRS